MELMVVRKKKRENRQQLQCQEIYNLRKTDNGNQRLTKRECD